MKPIVAFGEVMLRLATPGFTRFGQSECLEATFGGGEANVAVSLARFGLPVEYASRLPANDLGDACRDALRRHGVGVRWIARGGERLGIYFLETGAAQRGSKVIYDRAGSSLATIPAGAIPWEQVFAEASWFHWTGITPAVSQAAAEECRRAIEAARSAGVRVSCDLNYRKNLWKWGRKASEVMPELVALSDVAVGNEEDAERVFGIAAPGVDVTAGSAPAEAYRSVAESLHGRFPNLSRVAITLRGSLSASRNTWSGVLWDGGEFLTAPTYDIERIVDRVGGGDAFCAGLIYGLTQLPTSAEALRFAVAASCLKHSVPGDWSLVSVDEVLKLMAGDASGRVSR